MARFHIWNMCRKNPHYEYFFYDDEAIEDFIKQEFSLDVFEQYNKLAIGAAKADFFRYAILLKKGGIYVDIDSKITGRLDDWISVNDKAIITEEGNPNLYVQWALVFDKEHPFLKKTLDIVLENIRTNAFPNDVHKMTGPSAYTQAINTCLKESPSILHRILGVDYEGKIKFKYWLSSFSFNEKVHWKETQKIRGVLKE